MLARVTAFLVLVAIVAGCGGGSTPSQSPSLPSGGPSQGATPATGEPIDSAAVAAAIDALQGHESWTFEVTYITMGLETGTQSSITGTERRQPETAVQALHHQPGGEPDFSYVRIGDAIWYDVGTGDFTQVDAADAENLIEQYEPYYLSGLAQSALDNDFVWEPIGTETVNGVSAAHYRLSAADREEIVEILTDITADQWGGDVWIATDGSYLVGLTWGPQTLDTAQVATGFDYQVTDVDCECPIEPPT